MTTIKPTSDLQSQIEALVREHMAAQRKAASAAIERAFAAAAAPSRSPASQQPRRGPAKSFRKRPAEDLAALGERLLGAVRAHPGATMTTIAEQLGLAVRALSHPMIKLKDAGHIRSAGQRQHTRYFPMTSSKRQQPTE